MSFPYVTGPKCQSGRKAFLRIQREILGEAKFFQRCLKSQITDFGLKIKVVSTAKLSKIVTSNKELEFKMVIPGGN